MLYRGMYADAISALATYPNDDSDGAVEKLSIEAVAFTRQQQLSMANQRLKRAEKLCQIEASASCGDVLAARGILSVKQNLFAQARQYFLQASSFARAHSDAFLQVSASANLGWVALQMDLYDEAIVWLKAADKRATDLRNEDYLQVIAGNLGWAYYQLGDSERALKQFDTAEKSAVRLGNIRYELKWLSTAGYVYQDTGGLSRASQAYRRALDLAQQIHSKEDTINALEDLADIAVAAGRVQEAQGYIDQLLPLESTGDMHPSALLQLIQGKLAAAQHQDAVAQKYYRAVQHDPDSLLTVRLNAGYELARLNESESNLSAAERMFKTTLTTYESARAALKNEEMQLPFGANAAQIYDGYIHLLIREGKSDAALAAADQSRARTLEVKVGADSSKKTTPQPFAPRAIAAKTNSTLLFYWLGQQQSYLWAITPAKVSLFTLPAQREIAAHVESYRKFILDVRDALATANPDGQWLYQQLVAPAHKVLQPGKPVILLADGALHQLNFETLLVPGPAGEIKSVCSGCMEANNVIPASLRSLAPTHLRGRAEAAPRLLPIDTPQTAPASALHYLIDDYSLRSAPSLAMLAAFRPHPEATGKVLVIGNPVSPSADYPTLPLFGFEMNKVESHFGPSAVAAFAGPKATPAAYVASNPAQYAYIHFVSHAIANRTDPLDSAIILSNPGSDENAYKLYAREIIQHPIDARLVTISACYGSGTRSYAGEGLVGLSWAFLRAGAQRVIGALWEVSDESTPQLMDTLYKDIQDGDTPAAALREAKLGLLHSSGRFRLPFYWAPFQIYSRE